MESEKSVSQIDSAVLGGASEDGAKFASPPLICSSLTEKGDETRLCSKVVGFPSRTVKSSQFFFLLTKTIKNNYKEIVSVCKVL